MAILESIPGITVTVLMPDKAAQEHHDPEDPDSTYREPDSDRVRKFLESIHPNTTVARQINAVTVTRYIEAVPGNRFAVKVKVDPDYPMIDSKLGFYLYIDGQEEPAANVKCERPRLIDNDGHWEMTIKGPWVGKGQSCHSRGFLFTSISLSRSTKRLADEVKADLHAR